MGFRVYRPYLFPDRIDPALQKELRRLGVKFESGLHAATDAIVCLLGVSPRGRTINVDVGALNDELVLEKALPRPEAPLSVDPEDDPDEVHMVAPPAAGEVRPIMEASTAPIDTHERQPSPDDVATGPVQRLAPAPDARRPTYGPDAPEVHHQQPLAARQAG